ncbi:MAG TPA: hypothetical protein VHF69_03475 [Candidatus Synoicihabitans sp.]|nr:hypothetical protein [Candidatus Synoicihabitans sp.]
MTLVLLFVSALGTGCLPSAGHSHPVAADDHAVIVGPEYRASQGLHVPEATRLSLGVRLADVTEADLRGTVTLALRVYEVTEQHVRLSGMVDAAEAARLTAGPTLQLRADNGAEVVARIVASMNQGQASPAQGEVIAEYDRSALDVEVGTFFDARAVSSSAQAELTVPASALIRATEGAFVYTVNGEHFVRTPVQVGTVSGERVGVLDGLYAGDQVVAEGAMSLWLTELAAINGGHACCVIPPKGK